MTTIETIQAKPVYQQILKDSYGGIMYDMDNRDKYDAREIIDMWTSMPAFQRETAGGIMAGVFSFLKGDEV